MNTVKLYARDVYLKKCSALCTDVISCDGNAILTFDQTIFFPTGGGQSCDLGTVNELSVVDVYERDNQIFHKIAAGNNIPKVGDNVILEIDWDRRFDNMQRHCGEHILSGIFYREYGGVNRGFHMGDDYMTIDISLEENQNYSEVTWEMAKHAEYCANNVIWNNEPVTARHFNTRQEAEKLPLRKKLAIDEDITIVCVGDVTNASDCVACCGTHPAFSGQVGLIKIFKVEINKGMYRIYCEAGQRALLDYDMKHDILTTVCNRYSAGPHDLIEKMTVQENKIKSIKNELYLLKQEFIKGKISEIQQDLKSKSNAAPFVGSHILLKEFLGLKVDDLIHIGRPFIGNIDKLLLIIAPTENTLLLFSDGKTIDCGKLVKENASIYNGKGGGKADNARAMFPNREYLDTFIDLLEKHLR